MKRTIINIAIAGGLLLAVAAGAALYEYKAMTSNAWARQDARVYVRPGDRTEQVAEQLEATGGDTGCLSFRLACMLFRLERSLQGGHAGSYLIRKDMTAADVVRKIARRLQDPVKVTFIGIRSLEDLAGRLGTEVEADSAEILQAMYAPDFLDECGCDSANVCSIFLPDTYEVYWDITPPKLMRRFLTEYQKFWNDERTSLAEGLSLSAQQVSTLCSIAEEETTDRQERGTVARLYWNRYRIGMPLQADPTVKYAVGDFALRRILNAHLKVNSPYNTYIHPGLPPGPIRIVEKATIDAFLHSQSHKYLYMCAKEDFSGLHNFATTLIEHNRNAAAYHRALDQMKIKN